MSSFNHASPQTADQAASDLHHGITRMFCEAMAHAATAVWDTPDPTPLLIRCGLPGLCPSPDKDLLGARDSSRVQHLHNVFLIEHAHEISNAFTNRRIDHFVAKGAAFVPRYYPSGTRLLSDLDFYVRPEAFDHAVDILGSIGFAPLPESEQVGPVDMRNAMVLSRRLDTVLGETTVDLHRALTPVTRLLPRPLHTIPDTVWKRLERPDDLPVPAPAHHAALLTHQLVHTDLLHIRSLLDLTHLMAGLTPPDLTDYLTLCRSWHVERFANQLLSFIAREFQIRALQSVPVRSTGKLPATLVEWGILVARSNPDQDDAITISRIRRRLRHVDGHTTSILADLVNPPTTFLRWRWQHRNLWQARSMFYLQILRKIFSRRPLDD